MSFDKRGQASWSRVPTGRSRLRFWLWIAVVFRALPVGGSDTLPGIVFVSDDIFGERREARGLPRHGTSHWREGYLHHRATTQHPLERTTTPTRPGRNLYTLIPATPQGTLTRITHLVEGEVFDPEPSYDGRRILFSMRRDGEDWFHLYEIQADGTGLTQLTDGPFNDVSGVYLPDGRIVFATDRAGYLEEYHEERTETLWTMNGDGTGMEPLTFNPGTVFDPTVLADGRILFSLWDTFMLNIPPADKHETYLMTIRPDGTEESHVFGAGEHLFFSRERHSGVALTQAGQMPGGLILVQSELGPSLLDPSRGRRALDALWPVFPCATSVQLGGATHRVHLSPLGSRSTPYPLPDGRFLLAATLPGERDLGIYVADPRTREMRLVFNDPNRAEFDPRPILLQRPRPRVLPRKAGFAEAPPEAHPSRVAVTGRARFVIANARRSDNPAQEAALRFARYFRVVEALPTAVTSSSHTSLATRVLGEAPIHDDGSAWFEAPAETPLFLEPVDAAGRRIEFDWNQAETSVPIGSKQNLLEMTYISARRGEIKACNGCHLPQHEAADPRCTVAALEHRPVEIDRDATDLMYRRNDPDEYRATARIDELAKYRDWLSSPDADVRRRACEGLAWIEDGAREDAPAIAGLLADESAPVRRAAARALARLGSPASLPSLLRAAEDSDWQVRFHAASALEAITARGPVPPGRKAAEFYRELVAREGGPEGVRQALEEGPQAIGADRRRWFEAAGRLGRGASETARRVVRDALNAPLPPPSEFEPAPGKRRPLNGSPPELGAVRAAGWMKDAASVPALIALVSRHEFPDHATEAALALGRIGTAEAVAALWEALRRDVPNRRPFLTRYVQHGPRHEEYALLRGLILAGAAPAIDDVRWIVGLLPGTFLEKPRYEDRLRPESQRVLLARILLERANFRRRAVAILVDVLREQLGAAGDPRRAPSTKTQVPAGDPLYVQLLEGINLERPYAEHQRPFPVVERIQPEQALWLLGCLAANRREVPEAVVAPYLTSRNWRERIDAAVLLNLLGFGPKTAAVLAAEAGKPYAFGEIMGIGKSHFDPNFRDKCYMVMALAHHGEMAGLSAFADPTRRYRDVRYGLAVGLGQRGTTDAIPLLAQMASSDPIAVIRFEARQSLLAIQEAQRLAGKPVPKIHLPSPMPFEAWYPPRGLQWPAPVQEPLPAEDRPAFEPLESLQRRIVEGQAPANFRDLNNANDQAPGATHMMIRGMRPLAWAVADLVDRHPQAAEPILRQMAASPRPFDNYLALRHIGDGRMPSLEGELVGMLDRCVAAAETVRFYWACEAIGDRRLKNALPALVRLVHAPEPVHFHGPAGMGRGYPAARAIARLLADVRHEEIQRLLRSENVWVRAGALSGLTDARAPGIRETLEGLLTSRQPALIRDHAAVGLARLAMPPSSAEKALARSPGLGPAAARWSPGSVPDVFGVQGSGHGHVVGAADDGSAVGEHGQFVGVDLQP